MICAAIILAAGGHEQELVLVYAVAVFVSFLAGLLAMARFSRQQGKTLLTATNLAGAVAVAFTLVVNLARGYPLIAIAGTILVAGGLYWRWVRAGRPRGIEAIERQAEAEDDADTTGAVRHERRPGVSFVMVSREVWSACMESRRETTGLYPTSERPRDRAGAMRRPPGIAARVERRSTTVGKRRPRFRPSPGARN